MKFVVALGLAMAIAANGKKAPRPTRGQIENTIEKKVRMGKQEYHVMVQDPHPHPLTFRFFLFETGCQQGQQATPSKELCQRRILREGRIQERKEGQEER